jgi:choline dehydrogenase
VLANRLSADPTRRVLLLEAGGSHRTALVTIPAAEIKVIGNKKYDWMLRSEPARFVNAKADAWPRGKVLGGSSSINGMMWIRGHREDFDGWAQLGNPGWSYPEVLPYFRRSENNDIEDPVYHGNDGPVTVSRVATPHPLADTFIQAGVELGYPYNLDVNGERHEGVGPTQGNIRRGRRVSSATAFLDPIRHRSNLKVVNRALVHRILVNNGCATSVVFAENGVVRTEHCHREIVLSAGAVMSPTLLMRSGIGPARHLRALDIPVVHDLPGVGQNLQEHALVFSVALVNVSTYNTELGLHKYIRHGLNWLLFGRGPAASPISQAVAFLRTRPELASPDIQISFTPTGYTLDEAAGLKLLDRPAITFAIYKCRPDSVGSIELRSSDPGEPPRINANLLSAHSDVQTSVAGLRIAERFLNTKAFAPYFQGLCSPRLSSKDDSAYEAYVRETVGPTYHPVGTCKMGSDPMAVVDHRLRVRGVDGLRVVDASIMPRITSGNTNAPSIMIGEKAADMILA